MTRQVWQPDFHNGPYIKTETLQELKTTQFNYCDQIVKTQSKGVVPCASMY